MSRSAAVVQADQSYASLHFTPGDVSYKMRLLSGAWGPGPEDGRRLELILGVETGVNDDYNDKLALVRITLLENTLSQEPLPTPGSEGDLAEGGPR